MKTKIYSQVTILGVFGYAERILLSIPNGSQSIFNLRAYLGIYEKTCFQYPAGA